MTDITNIPGYNLVTLMKRLEAATSRLEDLTVFQAQALHNTTTTTASSEISTAPTPVPTPAVAAPVAVPVVVASAPAPALVPAVSESVEEEAPPLPPFVVDFDALIEEFVKPFAARSKEIDPSVSEEASLLADAFTAERDFLLVVSKSKKPTTGAPVYMDLFKPITSKVEAIQSIREGNRKSKFFNHLSTISEGVSALFWIGQEPAPVPFVGEIKDSAMFYSNRVLKEYRDVDRKHVEWAQGLLAILTALQGYIKKYHTTGPTWNPVGEDVVKVLEEASAPAAVPAAPPAPGAGGPPPPPPPPPPPASVFQVAKEPAAPAGGLGAVFAEINKGESVTAGLKKVDKSQMTHKNPALRAQEPIAAASTKSKQPSPPTKPQNLKTKKPPRMELEGTKWIVENYENNHEIIIEAELNHGVFIHRCKNCTVQIQNKFNTVTMNECEGTGLLVQDLVASVDLIKSKNFGLQVTGTLPTISIDQCDNGQIYLSKSSLQAEIYTSKSSGLNVNIPDETDEGDFKEQPVPEQLMHTIKNGKLVTAVVEYAG
ncbi:adenylate cyclase associated N terminal-domain-containing protein [Limtongia smithiae]|uniref:adenylate cyclase associated N terminal-domain-containing protein n=1 Tax=Limtongia smithiae TaxID=1125753 RepID=UPI0034CF0BAB